MGEEELGAECLAEGRLGVFLVRRAPSLLRRKKVRRIVLRSHTTSLSRCFGHCWHI